ncbi:MAG TPA: prolyl oligopeptidase family serine peptidase [Stenomitos sp.]
MRFFTPRTLVALSAVAALMAPMPGALAHNGKLMYPETKTVDQVDDYHGVKVADPYRWLEDPDSPETKAWIEAENKVTFGYLNQIPQRQTIKERLTKLWNYERYGVPFREGGRYFFYKNDGLQNQSVLYTIKSLDETPRVLIDPNKLSADGTVALSGVSISHDGKQMAYSISRSGSDWQEWKVRDVETGQDLTDDIQWSKFSGASWNKDGTGFYYSRYDEPKGDNLKEVNYYQKLYFHKVGTPQSEDVLVYERKDHKEWGFHGEVTEDGRYLVIYISQGTENKNRIYYKDLTDPKAQVVPLLDDFDAAYGFINNDGPVFWFHTTLDAPRSRVVAIDIRHPEKANWKELIPQTKDNLEGVNVLNDKFVAIYLQDAKTAIKVYDLKGKFVRDVELPGIGTAGGFSGKRKDTETFYSFTGFTTPGTIYRYDVTTGKSTVYREAKVDFNPAEYVTEQVFYKSKDGTKVPMFIVHKKGIKLDGTNPTYLYGYGGFNVSLTPGFSVSNLVWMEMGGIYAVPNLRGGGEYGEDWHLAGTKLHKQNVFDDFISAADWLIANKYTSSSKLAIGGGSNGGLLVGACLTQRPDLFAAALPAVGVLDMLRYQKFTIGWAWASDYGTSDDAEEFKALYKYSPLHNVKKGTKYPATMILTADHDDRVYPAHSFKFAAALQAAQGGSAPVLIRIETKAGHGAGKPTSKLIEEASDRWGFLGHILGVR